MQSNFQVLINTPGQIASLVSSIIVMFCTFITFIAVLIDFSEFQERKETKKEKKSIVETGTMILFFFLFYALIRLGVGRFIAMFPALKISLEAIGSLILLIGCFVNVRGRFNLGKNWSNQIKIYKDHNFISTGMYKFVRHPLYASIIWMFFGASIIYTNYAAFFANIIVFFPFMYYRAKQEEEMLLREFKEYKKYQTKVGMFFPKLLK